MEAIRKLRDRAKNKSRSQFEPYVDPDTNSVTPSTRRPSTSVWSRHGSLLSRHKSRTVSIDSSVKPPNDFQKFSSVNDAHRPDTSGRMQPKLVAVSRPSISEPRPDTAVSIQEAVDKAADLAAQSRSKTSSKLSVGKTARYIDIFAISSRSGKQPLGYNEDVASRNIDLTEENESEEDKRYKPSSKYQEEVASRNLNSPDLRGDEYDLDNHYVVRQDGSFARKEERTQGHGSGRSSRGEQNSIHQSQDATAYHSRQYASRNRDQGEQLPAIPQERSSDDGSVRDFENKMAQSMKQDGRDAFVERQRNRGTTMPSSLEASATEPNSNEAQLLSAIEHLEAHQKAGRSGSEGGQPEPLLDYQLTSSEMQRRGRRSANHSRAGDRSAERGQRGDSLRPPSNMSNASSLRRSINVGNRTIMDLTGDDSEVFSIHSVDYPETPVIQSATADTYQKLKPSMVDATGKTKNVPKNIHIVDAATPDIVNWPPTPTDNMRLDDDDDSYSVLPNHVTQRRNVVTPPARNFAFSRISTLASTSPRSSDFQLDGANEVDENGDPVPRRRSLDETLAKAHAQQPLLKAIKEDQVLSTGNTPVSTPQVQADSKTSPLPSPANLSVVNNPMDSALKQTETSAAKDFAPNGTNLLQNSSPPSDDPAAQKDSNASKVSHEPTSQSAPPVIHKSPESLQSSDFTHPTEAFGVKSRDFAFASNGQPVPKQSTPTPEQTRTTSKKPTETKTGKLTEPKKVRQNSSAPRKSRPTSAWDEEGFKRKQAEAKAALLRLQQSLNEELPPLESLSATRYDVATDSEDNGLGEGGPASPSAIFANERKHTTRSTSASQVPTTSQPNVPPRSQSRPEVPNKGSSRPSSKAHHDDTPSSSRATSKTEVRSGRPKQRQPVHPTAHNGNPKASPVNPAFERIDAVGNVPESPGEVSLSAFPLPISRDLSPDAHKRSMSGSSAFAISLVRRGSQASRMSSTSAYSIPFHMVPGRGSSLRDRIVVEQGSLEWE